jgi:hypothetical protein
VNDERVSDAPLAFEEYINLAEQDRKRYDEGEYVGYVIYDAPTWCDYKGSSIPVEDFFHRRIPNSLAFPVHMMHLGRKLLAWFIFHHKDTDESAKRTLHCELYYGCKVYPNVVEVVQSESKTYIISLEAYKWWKRYKRHEELYYRFLHFMFLLRSNIHADDAKSYITDSDGDGQLEKGNKFV